MNWIQGPPTPEQVRRHEREHSVAFAVQPGRITVESLDTGGRTHKDVSVSNKYAGSLWLVTNRAGRDPQIVTLRVIKKQVHCQARNWASWSEPSGDWLTYLYLPVTVSGVPVEYQEASDEVD